MANIELRNHLYCAVLVVPEDVRETIGKFKFRQALGTSNKREATLLAAPYVAKWKAQIRQARGETNAVTTEAKRWRDALSQVTDVSELETLEEVLMDVTYAIEAKKGLATAKEFHDVATGAKTPTSDFVTPWKEQIDLASKTKDQMIKDVGLLVAKFPMLESITKANVKKWVDEMVGEGKGTASIERILSFSRNFWRYLQSHDAVPADAAPLTGVLSISKAAKNRAKVKEANLPYTADEVVKLWEAAKAKPVGKAKNAPVDTDLANLIQIAAYSGARIEELCSLKVADIKAKALHIRDSKTAAGWRVVPIHSKVAKLVETLCKQSKDGYLLSGLTFNKYGDRSNAIGKRFGRLKTELGFAESHTFHSFRSTVITQLENAGISENLAADIVGHDKPRVTYGLYSGGADLETKRKALEKVSYPFPSAA